LLSVVLIFVLPLPMIALVVLFAGKSDPSRAQSGISFMLAKYRRQSDSSCACPFQR